jgi:hypothetical protein
MKERRKAKRHTLIYYMRAFDVRNTQSAWIPGRHCRERRHAFVRRSCPGWGDFPHQTRTHLKTLPTAPSWKWSREASGCHPDIDPHFYNAGFEILEMSPQGRQAIGRIIETYGLQEQRRAIANRPTEPPASSRQ